jgi:hypothetical protein
MNSMPHPTRLIAAASMAIVNVACAAPTPPTSIVNAETSIEVEFSELELHMSIYRADDFFVHLIAPDSVGIRRGALPQVQYIGTELLQSLLVLEQNTSSNFIVLLCVSPLVPYGEFVRVLDTVSRAAPRTVLNPPPHQWRYLHGWDRPRARVSFLSSSPGDYDSCLDQEGHAP